MSSIDYRAELARAGANVESRWSAVRFFARRYPLGAVGAVIMAVFLFAAFFAPLITVYDPLSTNSALVVGAAERGALAGLRFHGTRRL